MFTVKKLPGKISIVLENTVLINDAESLVKQLTELLSAKEPKIVLALEKLDEVDVTFFQIVLAFNKSLQAQGRQLHIQTLPNDHIVMQKAALLGIGLESLFANGLESV